MVASHSFGPGSTDICQFRARLGISRQVALLGYAVPPCKGRRHSIKPAAAWTTSRPGHGGLGSFLGLLVLCVALAANSAGRRSGRHLVLPDLLRKAHCGLRAIGLGLEPIGNGLDVRDGIGDGGRKTFFAFGPVFLEDDGSWRHGEESQCGKLLNDSIHLRQLVGCWALVRGMLVPFLQAVQTGGSPYCFWAVSLACAST